MSFHGRRGNRQYPVSSQTVAEKSAQEPGGGWPGFPAGCRSPPSEAVLRHPAKKFPNTWLFLSFACSHCLFQPKRASVQGQNRFIMEYIMSKVLIVTAPRPATQKLSRKSSDALSKRLGMRLPSSTPLTPAHPAFAMGGI